MRVAFLLDPLNHWLDNYIDFLNQFTHISNYSYSLSYDFTLITNQDIVFVLGYTKILPKDFIQSNSLCLVIHESDLPKGKGFSPVQWQILEGKNKIPVSLIKLEENVDSGEIFLKDEINLTGLELWDNIRKQQAECTERLIEKFLLNYPNLISYPQTGEQSFYRRFNELDDELDPNLPLKLLFNRLRIADNNNYPVFFSIDNKKYTIKIYERE